MRLFDLLVAKKLTNGESPSTVYQFAAKSTGTTAGVPYMTSLVISDGVTTIGNSAFSGCLALTSLAIPNTVTIIDAYAFKNCTALASLVIPQGVTLIGSSAFSGCVALKTLVIPKSVTSISGSAFYGCRALETIDMTAFDGSSVPALGSSAFYSNVRPEGFSFVFSSQDALDAFAAVSSWSTYSQYFEVAS